MVAIKVPADTQCTLKDCCFSFDRSQGLDNYIHVKMHLPTKHPEWKFEHCVSIFDLLVVRDTSVASSAAGNTPQHTNAIHYGTLVNVGHAGGKKRKTERRKSKKVRKSRMGRFPHKRKSKKVRKSRMGRFPHKRKSKKVRKSRMGRFPHKRR